MKINLLFTLTLFTLLLIIKDSSAQTKPTVVVIINKANPIETMTEGQVKLYYLKKVRTRWPKTNKSIKPVDISGSSPAKIIFLYKILKMTSSEVNHYFVQRQFSNTISPPTKVKSEEEVISFVSSNEGAIGFISKKAFDKSDKSNIKAVLTFQ